MGGRGWRSTRNGLEFGEGEFSVYTPRREGLAGRLIETAHRDGGKAGSMRRFRHNFERFVISVSGKYPRSPPRRQSAFAAVGCACNHGPQKSESPPVPAWLIRSQGNTGLF
jgi:hypothetical protein